jgi:GDPmannose 4,6-dehydratase
MWYILEHEIADDFLRCSGNVMSLTDLIGIVMGQLDLDVEQYIKIDPKLLRPIDLEVIYGDNTKAKSLLNWDYSISNEQLIATLIKDEYHFIEWESSQKIK